MGDETSLEENAEACRALATKFTGYPEEPFLLRLARALDEVAAIEAAGLSHSQISPYAPRWLIHNQNGEH